MSFPVEKPSPNDLTPSTPTWSAVIVMSLCCAVLIASEFIPVSLLTPIAFDLKMTEGAGRTSDCNFRDFCRHDQFDH